MEFELDGTLKEWAKDKPLSVLQLDPADRAVLRIAGMLLILINIYTISFYGQCFCNIEALIDYHQVSCHRKSVN